MTATTHSDRPVVVLMTTNGWGMGHLSRQLAIALALGDRAEPILLSLSGAVHHAAALGIRAEYLPSVSRGWLTATRWNEYLCLRLVSLAREVGMRALVFDGVNPYPGLMEARRRLPGVVFIWSRRGMWGRARGASALKGSREFDVIFEPGDLGESADEGLTVGRRDAVRLAPVSLLDVIEPLPRAEARTRLGLPADGRVALVSLSTIAIDRQELLRRVLGAVLGEPSWHAAVVANPLKPDAGLPPDEPRIHRIDEVYPLARYLRAFDAGIVSAGYNSAHELPLAGVPSLLIANTDTRWDDTLSRARGIAERGVALWARDDEPDNVEARTHELLGPAGQHLERALMEKDLRQLGGAQAAAALIARAARGAGPDGSRLRSPRRRLQEELRWTAVRIRRAIQARPTVHEVVYNTRVLGFKLLRRPLAPPRPRPTYAYVSDGPAAGDGPAPNADRPDVVLVTERLTREVIAGRGPVEQILPGTTERYRAERTSIAERFFPPAGEATGRSRG